MAAPNRPLTLFFTAPIYARGEHLIGEKAVDDDGKPNMIRVARGEKRRVAFEVAKDLIISKQAIDYDNAKPSEKAEAEASVRERNAADEEAAKKATQTREEEKSLRLQLDELRKEIAKLKKAA